MLYDVVLSFKNGDEIIVVGFGWVLNLQSPVSFTLGSCCFGGPHICAFARLRVVSNFGDGDSGAGEIHTRFGAPFASRLLELSRARVHFARPTIAIAKIRDYSQSPLLL